MRIFTIFCVIVVLLVVSFVKKEEADDKRDDGRQMEKKSRIANTRIEDRIESTFAKTETKTRALSKKSWQSFTASYGNDLQPSYHQNGKVISIRGEFGKGLPAAYEFNPMIRGQVEKRANEIMDSLKAISMLPDGNELSIPTIRTGPVSAQVFYKQKFAGYPVYPSGDIKVDIGPKGELLGFYSDYEPNLNVTNGFTIDHASAERTIRDQGYINERPGRRIIWTSGKEGRSAYEFYAEGKQIIVDADSSAILTTRDRRLF